MKLRIQAVFESDDETPETVVDLGALERGILKAETLGLSLEEAKKVLQNLQRRMIEGQINDHLKNNQHCCHCAQALRRNGRHSVVFRTLFGKFTVDCQRFFECACQHKSRRSISPVSEALKERVAPELLYMETKYASLMSYGLSVKILGDLLPLGEDFNVASVHNHVGRMAERIEQELGEEQPTFIEGCQGDWNHLSDPGHPLTVGLDGCYVHSKDQKCRTDGWFEIIVGKSIQEEGEAKFFGFVNKYDLKPKRRVFELLKSQGLQMNQQITFLSDGGDTVRQIPEYLSPESEHILDWFHITMRLTVMRQMNKGLNLPPPTSVADGGVKADVQPTLLPSEMDKHLDKIKWYLWHGNVRCALQVSEDLESELECADSLPVKASKLLKALREFIGYISNNQSSIPNYGDRYRHGETISTAFVESTVNCLVSKRFVKKQQMRWSQKGAHLLLQLRARVLNGELRECFERWYPGMKLAHEETTLATAA